MAEGLASARSTPFSVIGGMIEGLRQVAALPDPCGAITDLNYRPSGIGLEQQLAEGWPFQPGPPFPDPVRAPRMLKRPSQRNRMNSLPLRGTP